MNWGTNFKNQDWTVGGVNNGGWTSDLGLLMRITPNLKTAAVVQDIMTSKARLIPASLRLGVSLKPFNGPLLLAADAELYRTLPNYGHIGLELNLVQGLSLRGGMDRREPTPAISLDMAAFASITPSVPRQRRKISSASRPA